LATLAKDQVVIGLALGTNDEPIEREGEKGGKGANPHSTTNKHYH